jgi:hypothetical protein
MQPLLDKIRRKICSRFLIDHNRNYKSSIFLAGNARSGTTWISDIINFRNEYRYMFEPFHPYKVDACQGFQYRQYLRPDNKNERFLACANSVLTGRVRNGWIDSRNKKILSQQRLIKDVRANLMLKWIHVNFSGIPIILLFRHPCAVANSWMKLNWDAGLEHFLLQKDLMEDHLNPFQEEMESANDTFEKNIFSWCVQYYVPLKQFKKDEMYLAFYEKFCENPHYEATKLFSFLGKRSDDFAFAKLTRPSSESRADSAIRSGDSLVNSWRAHITKQQLQRAMEILTLFGLNRIYTDESMPHDESTEYFEIAV